MVPVVDLPPLKGAERRLSYSLLSFPLSIPIISSFLSHHLNQLRNPCVVISNLNVNSHLWLVAIVLESTSLREEKEIN